MSPSHTTFKAKVPNISVADCQRLVGEYYFIPKLEMVGKTHRAGVARPRQLAMTLALEHTGLPTTFIGKQFNRDHSTVIHAQRWVYERVSKYPEAKAELAHFRAKLHELSVERAFTATPVRQLETADLVQAIA